MTLFPKNIPVSFRFLFFFFVSISPIWAQPNEDDIKHEYHFTAPPIKKPEFDISFLFLETQQELVSAHVEFTNKTDQYIVYKPSETVFNLPSGNFNGTEKKTIVIEPMGKRKFAAKAISADNSFHVKQIGVELKGFYKIGDFNNVQTVPDMLLEISKKRGLKEVRKEAKGHFKLLPSRLYEQYTIGNFQYKINRLIIEGHVLIQLEMEYKGDKVGVIDPGLMTMTIDGTDTIPNTANEKALKKKILLNKKLSYEIVLVFILPKKTSKEAELVLHWNKALAEPDLISLEGGNVQGVFDPIKTMKQNPK